MTGLNPSTLSSTTSLGNSPGRIIRIATGQLDSHLRLDGQPILKNHHAGPFSRTQTSYWEYDGDRGDLERIIVFSKTVLTIHLFTRLTPLMRQARHSLTWKTAMLSESSSHSLISTENKRS